MIIMQHVIETATVIDICYTQLRKRGCIVSEFVQHPQRVIFENFTKHLKQRKINFNDFYMIIEPTMSYMFTHIHTMSSCLVQCSS